MASLVTLTNCEIVVVSVGRIIMTKPVTTKANATKTPAIARGRLDFFKKGTFSIKFSNFFIGTLSTNAKIAPIKRELTLPSKSEISFKIASYCKTANKTRAAKVISKIFSLNVVFILLPFYTNFKL
ncbi:Uncharacterised protein [Chlamydia trachomatis]|nr:Uncharacterised protein [Chlamydia trachomatis]